MTVIDPATTLGALVTAHPRLARDLERRGLDYCCGGGRTLDEACRAAGLDPETIAAEMAAQVDATEPPPEWAALDPPALVDHIVATHHRYLWDELPRLIALADKVAGVHGERHPELAIVATLVRDLRADLEPHLAKEERVLFPLIRELAAPATASDRVDGATLLAPITVMMREHDRAGELLARLRTTTDDYRVPDDGCASYRALYEGLAALEEDTHLHVHKENNLLFPAVLALSPEPADTAPERAR